MVPLCFRINQTFNPLIFNRSADIAQQISKSFTEPKENRRR